ncbi:MULTISPECIES: hypothetical protein [environmental samples]|jgi:uncharacterized membrane protein affecting hemolysin expression|uniref:hypothetical protein n=1 Tax=environmental samples TaxID=876090 RepID=UPI00033B9803|nr:MULTISPECIES: hypothetical protein [environmental samples]CDC72420.1 putative uncharacterized protein [Oscillibacter sp. CAG:155]
MEMAARMMWVSLLVLLVVVVGGILLQIFLSKRESKWPGLVLPAISFLWSLLYLFNLMDTGSVVQNILTALLTVLLSNIPTLVLLAIYWAVREKRRKRSELDKMSIDDL